MPARWEFELCDDSGTTLTRLDGATGRALTFGRNRYAEATCTIGHDDPAAGVLLKALSNGWPGLRCWRWGEGAREATLRFRGALAPLSESLEETATISLTFRSPFWRLQGEGDTRGRYTDTWINATAVDAGQAAASLVKLYGGRADGVTGGTDPNFTDATGAVIYQESSYCGLDIGTIITTVQRDLIYQTANVGEAIIALSAMLDGFDFDERYVDDGATLAKLDIYSRLGSQKDRAKFEYGPDTIANCKSVERQWEPPINHVTLFGSYGYRSVQQDAASVTRYGKWPLVQQRTNIYTQTELDRAAYALLRPDPVRRVAFVPEFGLDATPRPWDDFWLGDSVPFYARRDAFEESALLRVNQVTVPIDDEGQEAAEIPDPLTPGDEGWIRAQLIGEVGAT